MPRGGSKPGERRGGRKKGTPNKKTLDVAKRLKELNCDPLEGMVRVAQMAMEEKDLSVAGRMYSELAQYVAPKRKAVEMDMGIDEGVKEIKITYE